MQKTPQKKQKTDESYFKLLPDSQQVDPRVWFTE